MKEAAEYVNASHFIEKLPGGYKEPVSERGATFSAGERQLLSFARTLAHKPSILVMDEATANIDTETELLIQEALEKLMQGRTTIMVAHRLSTIQHADCIMVMHKGKSGNRAPIRNCWPRMVSIRSCMNFRFTMRRQRESMVPCRL